MKPILPAALAVLSILVPPVADAKPGNGRGNGNAGAQDGFCPPGLADRDPACVPPGQAGGNEAHDVEPLQVAERDDEVEDALAIIGALFALSALERQARAEREAAEAEPPPAPEPVQQAAPPLVLPRAPARPASIEALAAAPDDAPLGDAADPGPSAAEPVSGPPVPLGEPSPLIPPPPPLAENLPPAQLDVTDVLDGAGQDGATGF